MGLQTALFDAHVAAGAKIVDFGGWDMPLHYGSQLEEHHAVRRRAGVFDVSHMTVVDVDGTDAEPFLRTLLANDVAKLTHPGKALYSCMLNERGGVVDDLIVYYLAPSRYRIIVNAATRAKDLAWFEKHGGRFEIDIQERAETAMLAVQGPEARELAAATLPAALREPALALRPFSALAADGISSAEPDIPARTVGNSSFPPRTVSRTGTRSSSGRRAAVRPRCPRHAAPGGGDASLRQRHGRGNVAPDRGSRLDRCLGTPGPIAFIGRAALEASRAGAARTRFCGLLLEGKGVLRGGQRVVVDGVGDGVTTSGGFSPTLGRSIGLARLPAGDYSRAQVEIRNRLIDLKIVKTPFVRHGQVVTDVPAP